MKPVGLTSVFICPRCDWHWYRRNVSVPIPACERCGEKLERARKGGQTP